MVKALYDWIVDNKCTPHILVDAYADEVAVPMQYVNKDGQIVLNISPSAVSNLLMNADCVSFNARFGGVAMEVYVPSRAILGIYARENGRGMIFDSEDSSPEPPKPPKDKKSSVESSEAKRPSLRIVK